MSAESKKNIMKSAMLYVQEGKWDKAIAEYKKLLTLDPTDFNVHSMLGDAFIKKGDDALAYQEYMIVADQYKSQGLLDKASLAIKKIARLDPEKLNETDRKKLILIKTNSEAEKFMEGKEYEKAIDLYKEVLKINPEDVDTFGRLGDLYILTGNKEEALGYFKKITEIYYRVRLYKKVLPVLKKVIELDPDDIISREKLADIYEKEEMEDAKREYLFLAEYYCNKKDVDKTLYFGEKAVKARSIDAHYFYGWALYEKKQYEEAKRELETLLKFKASHVNSLVVMAAIQNENGQADDALNTLNKILKSDAENAAAQKAIGDIYEKKGMKKEAEAKYMAAIDSYLKKKETAEAELLFTKILSGDPENVEVIQKQAEMYANQDAKVKAADSYILIAEIYKKQDNSDKEREFYKLAEELKPEHPKLIARSKGMSGAAPAPPAVKAAAVPAPPVTPAASAPPPPKPTEAPKFGVPVKPSDPMPEIKPLVIKNEPPAAEIKPLVIKNEPPSAGIKPAAPFIPPPPADSAPMPTIPPPLPIKPVESKINAIPEVKIDEMSKMQAAGGEETKEDVPSLIALADSYVKSGSIDEALEFYQKAAALAPEDKEIKKKLQIAYSHYAGVAPIDFDARDKAEEAAKKAKEEEAKVKAQQEADKKAQEEAKVKAQQAAEKKTQEEAAEKTRQEAAKKAEEELRKKSEEAKKRLEEEAKKHLDAEAKRKDEEAAKKKEAEDIKHKSEDELKRKEEEAKRKLADEAVKKPKTPEPEVSEDSIEEGVGDDFVTVTTAEIFIKQGLIKEAEKILSKIVEKDPGNIEAKMKLDQVIALRGPEEKKDAAAPDKKKQSKVSYI